jgi:hypothetical protein
VPTLLSPSRAPAEASLRVRCPTLGLTLLHPQRASHLAFQVHGVGVETGSDGALRLEAGVVAVGGAVGDDAVQVGRLFWEGSGPGGGGNAARHAGWGGTHGVARLPRAAPAQSPPRRPAPRAGVPNADA